MVDQAEELSDLRRRQQQLDEGNAHLEQRINETKDHIRQLGKELSRTRRRSLSARIKLRLPLIALALGLIASVAYFYYGGL